MKIRIEWLPQFLSRQYLLQIFVACVAVMLTAQLSLGSDHFVAQWRSNNDSNITSVSSNFSAPVSHNLSWQKPTTVGANSLNHNSQQVVPLPDTESRIVFAQHLDAPLQPPPTTTPTPVLPGMPKPKTVDPYVQEHFNRNVPTQTPNPPTGATNTPSTSPTTAPDKKDDLLNKAMTLPNASDTPAVKTKEPTKRNQYTTITTPTTPNITNNNSDDILTRSFAPNSKDKDAPTHDCKVIGFKPISEISCDIKPRPGKLPNECPLTTEPYTGRNFQQTCFQWKASAVCTKGAYFENVQLERYGHSSCPELEPIISGVKFFTTIPILPYKAGLTPPDECVYTLGHYRVGNCAPHTLDPLPISVRAILFEGAAVAGAIALIP
ncbi:MAG: hypothetical protein LBH59_09915 [Planctomycetaceae bacterium]|jgi:hypothetical protein|nr:hypothetical protein [Planctomycetaceae bacterium]